MIKKIIASPFLSRDIFLGALTSLLFSTFIYLAYFHIPCKLCDSLLGLLALIMLLYIPRRGVIVAGFFIGLLWFYWIGFSFQYYNLHWMEPFVIFGFGIIYALFFGVLALFKQPYIRALLLFGLSFVEPFHFNWMKIELLFVNSYFGILKYDLAFILVAIALPSILKSRFVYLFSFAFLLSAIAPSYKIPPLPPLKIDLVTTHLTQNEKWEPSNLQRIVAMNLADIHKAIAKKYDLVVLPESAFPLYMNLEPRLIQYLQHLSQHITIITGTLLLKKNKSYNVTYMFQKGSYTIAEKMVLVPFGEYIPLPKFAQNWIDKTFFNGASDFSAARHPTNFIISGIPFRNAICFEATTDPIYKDHPNYVIAVSNNAWFSPSIEPTLQRLLMQYYAKKYHVVIFHAANIAKSGIIR